jgi:hypothetical protein
MLTLHKFSYFESKDHKIIQTILKHNFLRVSSNLTHFEYSMKTSKQSKHCYFAFKNVMIVHLAQWAE